MGGESVGEAGGGGACGAPPGPSFPDPKPSPEPLHRAIGERLDAWAERERSRFRWFLDVVFPVVAPIVLFALDRKLPFLEPDGVVPRRPYTSLLAFSFVGVFGVWMWARRRPGGWGHALLVWPLLAGGVAALGFGLCLLPMSAVGVLFFGIGLLGFIPFVTAYAFFRAALIANLACREALAAPPRRMLGILATIVLCAGVAGAARAARLLERRETDVLTGTRSGDRGRAEAILTVLWIFPQVPLDDLRWFARSERRPAIGDDPPLTAVYRRITGCSPSSSF